MLRSRTDPLPSLAEKGVAGYSQAFLEAVDRGLHVLEAERQQSVDEWLTQIAGPDADAAPATTFEAGPPSNQKPPSPSPPTTPKVDRLKADPRVPWRALVGGTVIAVGLGLYILYALSQRLAPSAEPGLAPPTRTPPAHPPDASPTDAHGANAEVSLVAATSATFRDCPECPEMVALPAGSYWMGSPSYEQGLQNEGPVHEVTISAPFAIGRHEVTVAEFGRFVDAAGYSSGSSCWTREDGKGEERAGRSWRNPGFEQSGRFPVVCVNWNDAQAYAAWLSRQTGEGYRLPSESEWEYAARAGTATSWGEDESGQCRHANGADASVKERYSDWTGNVSCHDGHVHTAPAGSFAANSWGLHDMLGNVWEWTADCWNDGYAGAPSDGSAWAYGDCAKRILRGGSWFDIALNLSATARGRTTTGNRNSVIGFRVVRTLTQPASSPRKP